MKNIGVVVQQPTLDLVLSVHLNFTCFAALHGLSGKLARSRAYPALDRLNMRDQSKETVRNLNGGRRRRLEIARCPILLFNGMQRSLSLVYDREMGSMRLLLTSPLSRWWLLICRLLASTLITILRVYVFLSVTVEYGTRFSPQGYLALLLALLVTGMTLGGLGLALS